MPAIRLLCFDFHLGILKHQKRPHNAFYCSALCSPYVDQKTLKISWYITTTIKTISIISPAKWIIPST